MFLSHTPKFFFALVVKVTIDSEIQMDKRSEGTEVFRWYYRYRNTEITELIFC